VPVCAEEMKPIQRVFRRVPAVLLAALTISCLNACAISNAPPGNNARAKVEAQTPDTTFQIPVVVKMADGSDMATQDRPGDLAFVMGAISGSISGYADRRHMLTFPIGQAASVKLDLTRLGELSAQAATAGEGMSSVEISPRETRFARVATIGWSNAYARGSAGFIDAETRDGLLLAYFDRPCRLSGTSVRGGQTDVYDVTVDSAGWVWLTGSQDAWHSSLRRATTPHPTLVVTF
jgi:hypothetical protein